MGSLREVSGSFKEFCRSLGTIWEIKEAHVIYRSKSFNERNCLIAVDLIEIEHSRSINRSVNPIPETVTLA